MGNQTKHYKNKRCSREKFIDEHLYGNCKVVDSFIVDKGHVNGLERHDITENGIIVIYNAKSNKLVTKLIARPAQIQRYYKNIDKNPPRWLMDLAQYRSGLNYNK